MEVKLVDTVQAVEELICNLELRNDGPPNLYIDLEGIDLSRNGTISILTLLVEPRKTVHLIDITTLGSLAFSTGAADGRTLKSILESPDVTKVFFDIRNDSDALFSLYGIHVAGIQDLQLMELATRVFSKRCVNGLAKCIERDAGLGFSDRQTWSATKERGRRLFAPECGGRYSVFDDRPLPDAIKEYCAQDVTLMPVLREVYRGKLSDSWWTKINAETTARIALSQSPSYNGKGRHMALGPSSWT